MVYVAWASHGDFGPYHGLIAGFDAATLQFATLNVTPNGSEGGIWMGGGGPAADSQGNLFVTTGNGTFDSGPEYGDSFLKVATTSGLAVADFFTPFNQDILNQFDVDLGSSGVLLLPDQPGPHPHEMISGGKDGNLYVVDRDALGGFNSTASTNVQTLAVGQNGNGMYDTPAYFNNTVYVNPTGQGVEAFPLVNGQLTGPSSADPTIFSFPGATPSISANGSAGGIVWENDFGQAASLHAYDASNVANELYDSSQAGSRDQLGPGVKFSVPTVANGHVYVGTATNLTVFGLLSSEQTAAPADPSGLTATVVSPTDVRLNWTVNSTNATSFTILRSTDGADFTTVGTRTGLSGTFDDLSAAVGASYTYQVQAVNGIGASGLSNAAAVATPPVPGLVGYWQFNEGSGITTADASGNGDAGTLSGETTWVSGKVGPAALNFHGAGVRDAHVQMPDEPALRFGANDSFTVGAWVQPNALDSKWAGIITKSTDAAPGYGIFLDPSNHWAFATSSDVNVIEGPVADTDYHYLTAVQDGQAGVRRLYLDGTLVATGAAEDASGTGDLWVGGSKATNAQYFNGQVDDLRIYNRALSDSEVAALASATVVPPANSGTISGTVFNDANLDGVQDAGEEAVVSTSVFIDLNGNGSADAGEPRAVTDINGNYTLSGLGDGTYHVVAATGEGFRVTAPAAGFNLITISGSESVSGINFGLALKARATGDHFAADGKFRFYASTRRGGRLQGNRPAAHSGTAQARRSAARFRSACSPLRAPRLTGTPHRWPRSPSPSSPFGRAASKCCACSSNTPPPCPSGATFFWVR